MRTFYAMIPHLDYSYVKQVMAGNRAKARAKVWREASEYWDIAMMDVFVWANEPTEEMKYRARKSASRRHPWMREPNP